MFLPCRKGRDKSRERSKEYRKLPAIVDQLCYKEWRYKLNMSCESKKQAICSNGFSSWQEGVNSSYLLFAMNSWQILQGQSSNLQVKHPKHTHSIHPSQVRDRTHPLIVRRTSLSSSSWHEIDLSGGQFEHSQFEFNEASWKRRHSSLFLRLNRRSFKQFLHLTNSSRWNACFMPVICVNLSLVKAL